MKIKEGHINLFLFIFTLLCGTAVLINEKYQVNYERYNMHTLWVPDSIKEQYDTIKVMPYYNTEKQTTDINTIPGGIPIGCGLYMHIH